MDRLEELKQRIDKFNKDRDWDQFHSPVNLAKSISIEANELLECYQWNDNANLEDVKERYCVSQDKAIGIVNDCNKYSDDPKYVLNLLLNVISMSIKINETIKELPDYEEI